MKKVTLFLNTIVGFEIAKFLLTDDSIEIETIFLSNQYPEIDKKIQSLFLKEKTIINVIDDKSELDLFFIKKTKVFFLICVYWPYLLNKNILSKAENNINFHPALLPINRGWYPHVHSIIDESKAGVTLHEMNEYADKGDILSQKEVKIPQFYCAKEAYELLQNEMIKIFVKNWSIIRDKKIKKIKQNESYANYHKKNEIDKLDFIDISKKEYKDLINILRARTFGDKGYAYFLDENNEKIFMTLKLNK